MRPVCTPAEMRAADEAAQAEVGLETLVQRAGRAVSARALSMMAGGYGRRVVVVAGRGHNGDDGRVAARVLTGRGARCTVIPAGEAPRRLPPCDLVVDAAYGTGFRGSYDAPAPPPWAPVLAVDIPSGVDAETGEAAPGAVVADVTVTFAALKLGLLLGEGKARSGVVHVADIGLDPGRTAAHEVEDADVGWLAPLGRDAHKWQHAVTVVAGSPGMLGSAELCSRAAMRSGSGMVRLASPGVAPGTVPVAEVVAVAVPPEDWAPVVLEQAQRCKALVLGPGLGTGEAARVAVRRLLAEADLPVVLDADGLNCLGKLEDAQADPLGAGAILARRSAPVVLTPHEGEFARLTGHAVGADRLAEVRDVASRFGVTVLLKGSTTVVAAPEGDVLLAAAGSSRLATAGTGDVLSGVIGAFLARGLPPLRAAALGAHVHGRAAGLGRAEGLVAGDLPGLVSAVLSTRRAPDRVSERYRPNWLEVDLSAIEHNARVLARLVSPAALCAVVKADAYGHGAAEVAPAALAGGAGWLAVALVEEGLTLRRAGVSGRVLVLSEPSPDGLEAALRAGLTPTLYTPGGIAAAACLAVTLGDCLAAADGSPVAGSSDAGSPAPVSATPPPPPVPVPVQVKVDTGMHRVGADAAELPALAGALAAAPALRTEALWSHLALAEDTASPVTDAQLVALLAARRCLAASGVAVPLVHLANSAGAIAHPETRLDLVRCGIAVYGYSPIASSGIDLRPALSWKARVHLVRRLAAGERVSYGLARPLEADSQVAVVPAGYHDGVPRRLFDGGGEVLIRGRRRPIAGTVTMDQIIVDCGPEGDVQAGDEVVLIGYQGEEAISAEEWARRLGTISWEVLCGIGPRVPASTSPGDDRHPPARGAPRPPRSARRRRGVLCGLLAGARRGPTSCSPTATRAHR